MTGAVTAAAAAAHDAVVLAGGESRRLGGVPKDQVVVGGRTMLDRVLDATRQAHRVVVVGPREIARPGVVTTLEDPPSGGPVAGIAAGLEALDGPGAPHVLVLACDLPLAARVVTHLLAAAAAEPAAHGAAVVDADGRPQHLLAVYRRDALDAAVARLAADGGVRDRSVRRLVRDLVLVPVQDLGRAALDGDTWESVAELDRLVAGGTAVASTHEPVGPELHRWVATLVEELDVDAGAVDVEAVLDLAREAASGVARPAVPLTGFLVGYAVARRGGDRAAFEQVNARVTALAREWAATKEGR